MPDPGQPFPAQLKHFELRRLLGQGGMGMVVEGIDRRDGSRVAVKLLHPHLVASDPTYLDRFEREAHVAALLRSPYTVHLVDYGVEGNTYFLVMEFVEGHSLAERLAHGPLPPDEALRIAGEVARALEEAGARGIVHRDIKPENILLDEKGRVKVTDFGIARSTAAPGITMTGGFVGTPAFAAPEQVDGNVDHRSDIYALGVTLYTMLTGRTPFQGKTAMDTLFQHRTAPLPMAPIQHLPDPVQNLVRRCLEKDPLDRYQTASELAGAIDRGRQVLQRMGTAAPAGLPTAAPPAPSGQQPGPMARSGQPSPAVAPPPTGAPPPAPFTPPPTRVQTAPPAQFTPPPTRVESTPPVSGLPPGWSIGPQGAPPARPPAPPRPPLWKRPAIAFGALGTVVGLAVFGAVIAVASLGGDDEGNPAGPDETPSPTATATRTVTRDAGGGATATPTPPPPTPTPTPEGGWARINRIRLDGNTYVVDFETSGFAYSLPGIHVHFFFDTVPVEQAGAPGGGPWAVYGGPSPFTDYTTADRLAGSRQLCVLVANPDHSIRPGTGNCVDLP